MRDKHTVQGSIFEHCAEHGIGLELKSVPARLDQNMDLFDWVAADINPCSVEDSGRTGLRSWSLYLEGVIPSQGLCLVIGGGA